MKLHAGIDFTMFKTANESHFQSVEEIAEVPILLIVFDLSLPAARVIVVGIFISDLVVKMIIILANGWFHICFLILAMHVKKNSILFEHIKHSHWTIIL